MSVSGIPPSWECDFCRPYGGPPCATVVESRGGRVYACTRPPGHPGDHVACGTTTHDLHRWPQKTEES